MFDGNDHSTRDIRRRQNKANIARQALPYKRCKRVASIDRRIIIGGNLVCIFTQLSAQCFVGNEAIERCIPIVIRANQEARLAVLHLLGKGPHLARHRRYLNETSLEPFVFRLRTVKDCIDQWCKNNIAVHHHLRQLPPIDKARGHHPLFIRLKRGRYIENPGYLEVELRIRIKQPNQVWDD